MTPEDVSFVAEMVENLAGVIIRADRGFFIETRLMSVARREKVPGVTALLDQLRRSPDPGLERQVVEATLMQETNFFRDRKVFSSLRKSILPELATKGKGRLRILSAGCATGQEAYSIAMLAAEVVPESALEIVALDFSGRQLEKAQSGLYSHFEVQRGLPIRRLLDNFDAVDDNWRVRPDLRQCIHWVEHNLLDDMSGFGEFELVMCRNVLGALTPAARTRVSASLDLCCGMDGLLMVGAGESADLSAAFSPTGTPGVWRRSPAFARAAAQG